MKKLWGHFWYSQKMMDAYIHSGCHSHMNFARIVIGGRLVEYTHMPSNLMKYKDYSNWGDSKYLGVGYYHHSEEM